MKIHCNCRKSTMVPNVQCTICKSFIIDIFEGPCGCLYCRNCIDNYFSDLEEFCHEKCFTCGQTKLPNDISENQEQNDQLSQQTISCPNELCTFSSSLENMCHHLEECEMMSSVCPYQPIDWNFELTHIKKCIAYLQCEICPQSKFIADYVVRYRKKQNFIPLEFRWETIVDKLISELSKKQNKFQNEYKELQELQQKMSELSGATRSMEKVIENQNLEIEILKQTIDKHVNEENNTIKEQQRELNNQIAESKKKEIRITKLEQKLKRFERHSKQVEKYSLEKIIKISSFRWAVDNIKEMRSDGEEMVYSDFFYSINKEYKMRLWMYPNGNGPDVGENISIQLLVWSNDNVARSGDFPFKADVSMTIRNAIKSEKHSSFTQLCLFEKPSIFIYSISESFHFNYTHLNYGEILQNALVLIECIVWIYR